MSKYTTEVRYICESYAGLNASEGYDKVDEIVEASRSKIFGNYPIFDENYRSVLENKILIHYYTREISEETVGLWKIRLNNIMNEIMPYFNKLYESELIQFNPMFDIDLTRDYQKKNDGTTDSTGNQSSTYEGNGETENSGTTVTSSTGWNMFSDTPQGGLNGLVDQNYMSNATKVTSDETVTNENTQTTQDSSTTESSSEYNTTINGLEDYIEHIKGVHGGMSYSKRLKEFRDTFLNIDMQIIDNLKNLFFYLW